MELSEVMDDELNRARVHGAELGSEGPAEANDDHEVTSCPSILSVTSRPLFKILLPVRQHDACVKLKRDAFERLRPENVLCPSFSPQNRPTPRETTKGLYRVTVDVL